VLIVGSGNSALDLCAGLMKVHGVKGVNRVTGVTGGMNR
jgi:hypothetical protein